MRICVEDIGIGSGCWMGSWSGGIATHQWNTKGMRVVHYNVPGMTYLDRETNEWSFRKNKINLINIIIMKYEKIP